jgi:hypothetical protein
MWYYCTRSGKQRQGEVFAIFVATHHCSAYLQAHAGRVSPVTLDIGAIDVLPDPNPLTCVVNVNKFYFIVISNSDEIVNIDRLVVIV